MGCRIIVGNQEGSDGVSCAVFFDSTKMVAFGPVMGSQEEAEAFMKWLTDQGENEPREQTEKELIGFHAKFAQEMVCECGTVREKECEFCASDDPGELVTLPHAVNQVEQRQHRWPWPKCKHCGAIESDHFQEGFCYGRWFRDKGKPSTKFEAGEEVQVENCSADVAPAAGERFRCAWCRRKDAEEAERRRRIRLAVANKAAE